MVVGIIRDRHWWSVDFWVDQRGICKIETGVSKQHGKRGRDDVVYFNGGG